MQEAAATALRRELEEARQRAQLEKEPCVRRAELERSLDEVSRKLAINEQKLAAARSDVEMLAGYVQSQTEKSSLLREQLRQLSLREALPSDDAGGTESRILAQLQRLQQELAIRSCSRRLQ